MIVETNITPLDTFEVSSNISETVDKAEPHLTDYGFTTLIPVTLEDPGMEEEHC